MKTKTPKEIETQVREIMKKLHGRVYIWKKYEYWNEMTGKVTKYIISYRKGQIEIDPDWTKEELREVRLKELGI